MAIERIYFREHKFVLTLIYGKLTNAEIGAHVIEMNQECKDDTGLMELADCRFLTDFSELDAKSLMASASLEKGQARTLGGKGAIVVANETVYGLARVFATIAAESRIDSQVYWDIDKAMNWLGISHLKDEISAHCSRISALPVTAS